MARKLLVVEGDEDHKFFKALLRKADIGGVDVSCHPAGKGNAINTFIAALALETAKSSSSIGLVVDADFPAFGGGFHSTRTKVNQELAGEGFGPVADRKGGGLVSASQKKQTLKCGIWVMPDNSSDGFVEDLLVTEIGPGERDRLAYAGRCFQTALTANLGFPTQAHHHRKAEMGTYLAWQDPARISFAHALQKDLFDLAKPNFSGLRSWLNWLYS